MGEGEGVAVEDGIGGVGEGVGDGLKDALAGLLEEGLGNSTARSGKGVGVGVGDGVIVPVPLGLRDLEGVSVGVGEGLLVGVRVNVSGRGEAAVSKGVGDCSSSGCCILEEVGADGGVEGAGGGGDAPNESEAVGVPLCEGVGLGVMEGVGVMVEVRVEVEVVKEDRVGRLGESVNRAGVGVFIGLEGEGEEEDWEEGVFEGEGEAV